MAEKKFVPDDHFISLKGKDYLPVMWRLVWFREDHPDWCINTEILEHVQGEFALVKCEIVEPCTEHVLSVGHGSETRKDFNDYLEKAETKSVGRALAMLGYGTQFAPELDEGERLVDSPVDTKKKQESKSNVQAQNPVSDSVPSLPSPGEDGNWHCDSCKAVVLSYLDPKNIRHLPKEIVEISFKRTQKVLCYDCLTKAVAAKKNAQNAN